MHRIRMARLRAGADTVRERSGARRRPSSLRGCVNPVLALAVAFCFSKDAGCTYVHVEVTESTPGMPPAVRTPTRSVCVCGLAHRACPLARLPLAPSAPAKDAAASSPDACVADSLRGRAGAHFWVCARSIQRADDNAEQRDHGALGGP